MVPPEPEQNGIAVANATVTTGLQAGGSEVPAAVLLHLKNQAHTRSQIDLNENRERQGRVRLLKSVGDLEHHLGL